MEHQHQYDTQGNHHGHDHGAHNGHDHINVEDSPWKMFLPSISALLLLLVALYFDHFLNPDWFTNWIRIGWYIVAYLPVGVPVLKEAYISIVQ